MRREKLGIRESIIRGKRRGEGFVQDEDGYYFFGFDESGESLLFFDSIHPSPSI